MAQRLQIGEVARQTALTADAIRFYERCGLLKSPQRTEGGYRLFRPGDIQTLKFIRRAQDLGFSLREIRELLFLQSESIEVCGHVQELVGQKLETVRGKIAELREIERDLEHSLRKCHRRLHRSGAAHAEPCPVLNGLRRTSGHREG
ncbi:MAG: heavy metal-responsive transcriptional regulator [Bryobacteraceae bacterium]